MGVTELWNVNDYFFYNSPGSSSGTEIQTLSLGILAPVLLGLFPSDCLLHLSGSSSLSELINSGEYKWAIQWINKRKQTSGGRRSRSESSEEVFVLDKVPETERVQFSALAFLVLLHASFLMLLLTEMLQRLKTGELVVRESLSMSYKEGI